MRRAELQRGYAREMIEAVEAIKSETVSILELPLVDVRANPGAAFIAGSAPTRALAALSQMQNVARTSAILCGNAEIRKRMSALWIICERARGVVPRGQDGDIEQRLQADIIAYSVFTILGIEQWASYEEITAPNTSPPDPFRKDNANWSPSEVPATWQSLLEAEPLHPQYKPIRNREL